MSTPTLQDIVQHQPTTVPPDCPLHEAVLHMHQSQCSSLLVMQANRAVGIVTEHDLIRLLHYRTPPDTAIHEVMSHPLLSAPSSMDINTAYTWLLNQNIRHLVVEDTQQHILGVVSEQDFRQHMGLDVLRQLGQLDHLIDKALPTLSPDATLGCALNLMLVEHVSYVLVSETQRAVGILTEQDIPPLLLKLAWKNPDNVRLGDVMISPVPTTHAQQSVATIAALMQERNWQQVVLIDHRENILGVITLHNLLGRITSTLLNQQLHEHQGILEQSLYQTNSRLNMIAEAAHLGFWEMDVVGNRLYYSETLNTITGRNKETSPKSLEEWQNNIHPEDRPHVLEQLDLALNSQQRLDVEYRTVHATGRNLWLHVRGQVVKYDPSGRPRFAIGTAMDITDRKLFEILNDNERNVLEQLGKDLPLPEFLNHLAHSYEMVFSHTVCFVSMLHAKDGTLETVAAPSLPAHFKEHIQHLPINITPCGQATLTALPTLINNTENNPLWYGFNQISAQFQLKTTWAIPILSRHQQVLGAFTMCSTRQHDIQPLELKAIQRAAYFAALAIERHQQQRDLHLNSEILRRAQAVAETGSWTLDVTTGMVQWSDETYRIFGLPVQSEINIERVFSELIFEEDRLTVMNAWQAALNGAEFDTEHRILRANKIRHLRVRAQLERDHNGQPVQAIGTIQDVTERHQNREKIQLLAEAVEQSHNAIMITDLAANIQYINSAFLNTTGYCREEVMGRNPRFLKSLKTPASVYENMWAHLTSGQSWRGELINRRKDGSEYYDSTMISPVRQSDGRISNYLAIKEDLSRLKAVEASLQQLSNFDPLTTLPNRNQIEERTASTILAAQQSSRHFALLYLDLDHFKNINDTLGHRSGDTLLTELSNRLRATIRKNDTLARTGGDEFVLLLTEAKGEEALRVADKILRTLSQPCQIETQELSISASIGIAMYPEHGNNFDALLQAAEVAMYRAKQNGRNGYSLYSPEMHNYSSRQMQLENALRQAIQRQELALHYQAQFDLAHHTLLGMEVLLRWQHPQLGWISPGEFIPIAEDSGQILQIGEWVLNTAMAQLRTWLDAGYPELCMAVNLSAIQFRTHQLPEKIDAILAKHKIPPHLLELELTESVAMDDPASAVAIMDSLHQRGILLSIDDFGTGYSSLSYLKRFKVHKLKIDQSFVRHINQDADDRAIVSAVINMAASLGFLTLAEGVETDEQATFLHDQGCNQAQGYYFAHPMPSGEFEVFMTKLTTHA